MPDGSAARCAAGTYTLLNSAQELRDSYIETLGQNFQGPQSGFFFPCFQVGYVWPANAGMRGQVVLVPTPAFPQLL